MLSTTHPDDERLSAHASGETDADERASITLHLAACTRCQSIVSDLRAIQTALAELPDLAPPRPLRLLPAIEPATEPAGDRLTGWVRRVFAPVLTAGAALALVGVVGTALPAVDGMGAGAQGGAAEDATTLRMGASDAPAAAELAPDAEASDGAALFETETTEEADSGVDPAQQNDGGTAQAGDPADDRVSDASLPAERSPWPMVLFTGVALMIGAVALRWILAPRAG